MVEIKKTGRAIKALPVFFCGGLAEESPGALYLHYCIITPPVAAAYLGDVEYHYSG